jgi:hypothetical protein
MFERLGSVRRRFGISAMLAVGAALLVWGFLQVVGAIDTARNMASPEPKHWVRVWVEVLLAQASVPQAVAWVALLIGLAILVSALVLIIQPDRLRGRPAAHADKKVDLFVHGGATESDIVVAARLETILTRRGWTVTHGLTNLPIHRSGIWILGQSTPGRTAVSAIVRELGLSFEIDDRSENVRLQIVVGRTGVDAMHEFLDSTGTRNPFFVGTPRPEISQVEPGADRVGGDVWVTWHLLTPVQMRLRVQNDTARIINGVQISVTDLGLISNRHGTRIPVQSAHSPNGAFVGPYTLLDSRRLLTIYPGGAKKMPFLRREGANMHQTGHHGPAATREVPLPDRGEWEFDLNLTWDEKALPFRARVRWTGDEIQPLFLKAITA